MYSYYKTKENSDKLVKISAHQCLHRPRSGPSWFYRVDKRPPVKEDLDLAIYSPINGVSRVWLSC